MIIIPESVKDRMFGPPSPSGFPFVSMSLIRLLNTVLPGLMLLAVLTLVSGCGRRTVSDAPPSMTWTEISGTYQLPAGVEIFEGVDEIAPLKAWLARIDASRPGVEIEIISSDDEDGRESVSDMVRSSGACLGVNGGYFLQTEDSFEHIGLLIADGTMVHGATHGIFAEDERYELRRAAIGFDASDRASVAWVTSQGDSSFWWSSPVSNVRGEPAIMVDSVSGDYLPMEDALAAGPALLRGGVVTIPVDEEVFFQTTIPNVHPRTAAGIDADGRILLMVVDGRQSDSRGVSLEELAALMLEFGAVDALNLDGGGSSTFIVGEELLNRPAGATYQREVVSGIVIHCS